MSQSRNIVTNDLSSSHCGELEKYETPNGASQMARQWDIRTARVPSKVPRFVSHSLCPQLFKWTHSVDPNLPDQGDDGGMWPDTSQIRPWRCSIIIGNWLIYWCASRRFWSVSRLDEDAQVIIGRAKNYKLHFPILLWLLCSILAFLLLNAVVRVFLFFLSTSMMKLAFAVITGQESWPYLARCTSRGYSCRHSYRFTNA